MNLPSHALPTNTTRFPVEVTIPRRFVPAIRVFSAWGKQIGRESSRKQLRPNDALHSAYLRYGSTSHVLCVEDARQLTALGCAPAPTLSGCFEKEQPKRMACVLAKQEKKVRGDRGAYVCGSVVEFKLHQIDHHWL